MFQISLALNVFFLSVFRCQVLAKPWCRLRIYHFEIDFEMFKSANFALLYPLININLNKPSLILC